MLRIVGDGMLHELAYTVRQFGAIEAHSIGLMNRVHSDHQSLLTEVTEIAVKSLVAVTGTKAMSS